MKIQSLSVRCFGKLKNVNLTFDEGINVISNVNGFGKTTLANFIRAMLYGFSYRVKDGVKDSSRFTPWDGTGKFGGSIVVEHNGENYRIERFFGATLKAETKSVINVKTNKQVDFGVEIGEYFLGLTADSYDRSAYFPQDSVELSSNDNFDSRLANLVEDGAEDYDKVQKRIRDFKRDLRLEKGYGGKIFELQKKERDLTSSLSEAVSAERRDKEIENRLLDISKERCIINERQSEVKTRLDEINGKIARTSLTEAERNNLKKLAELESKLARVPKEIEEDKAQCDRIVERIKRLRGDIKPKIYPNVVVLTVSVLLFVAGIVLFFVLPKPAGYAVGVIAAVLGVVGAVVSFVRKGAKTLVAGERDAFVTEYYNIAKKYFYVDDKDFDEVVKTFWAVYSDYVADARELETLRSVVKKPAEGESELQIAARQLDGEINALAQKLVALSGEEGRLTQEKSSLRFDGVISINEELADLRDEIKLAEIQFEIADKTSKLLAQAKDNLSSSYLPKLCRRSEELLSYVTGRNYEVLIDRQFGVKLSENGQIKPMSEFSRGVREITLLCFRVALSELLYDGQIPFIIIDDAFVNFDEQNFVRATELLKKISSRGQVIYFTCHNRVGNLLN